MKNLYDETSKFAMADDNDYDEYEEEVIERDEEYDDDDDYEEEYDDENGEDEEYDDEEYEEEPEEYDDGYDDQYYDDRLNQVLDELAELKRNMAAPAVQQQPAVSPLQPHLLFSVPQNNGNEVAMYNEISRLRDELSKTQNTQSLHVEMSRLKEDMEREQKQNESQFLSEIKRLNERIEELQQADKNKNAPALANANAATGLLPEANRPALPAKELNKLVTANETLLRATQDNGNRIFSDLSEVKTTVADVKTCVESMAKDDEWKKAVDEIRASVLALQENPQGAENGKKLEELNAAVAALKTAVGESAGNAAFDPKLLKKLARSKSDSVNVDITEVIRSVYELKGMLGSSDPNQQSLVNMALKAYTDLDLLHVTVANSTDFRMKLEAVENFVSAVNAQDFITSDALASYEIVLKRLLDTPLDRAVFDSLCSFATATGKITVSSAKKEAANKYISLAERAKREETDSVIEFLPEMITAINDAEGAKNVGVLSGLYDDIAKVQEERKTLTTETDKREAEAEIKSLIAELCDVRVGDVVTYAPVMPLPTSDALNFTEGDSVSDRLDALMQTVLALREAVDGLAAGGIAPSAGEDGVAATAPAEVAYSTEAAENTGDALLRLQSALAALEAKVNLDGIVAEMQRSFASVSGRLANIESRLSGATEPTETIEEPVAEVYTEETEPAATANAFVSDDISARLDTITEKIDTMGQGEDNVAVLDDLAFIKDKLTEEEALLGQIEALRADVAAVAENAGSAAQFDKLYEDVVAQFDKLYDDLAAVDGETAEKINGTLAEIKEAVDGIVASDLSSAVLDGIIDFRTTYEENSASSAEDRKKLLDDVAYLREQAEKQADDESARQTAELQAEIAENIKALDEKIAALADSEAAINDEQTQSAQNVALRIDEIGAALEELKEKSVALEEGIQANGLLATENQATVSEDLTRILEQLTPAADSDQTANLYDEIVSISGRLDEIRTAYEQANGDTMTALAEIKEQVHLKQLEQNLAAVSASEEEKETLLTEISSLRERLSTLENEQKTQADAAATQLGLIIDQITALGENLQSDAASEIVKMQDDITFIRNQIEVNMDGAAEEDPLAESLENEGLSLIMDDIAAIKEKLATLDEYDTVAEILSLREDVKNTHLLDANDLSAELEGLKGDLLELKADIADIKTSREEADTAVATGDGVPTSDEVNMLLGEIVSLRDEIQAYKDDVADIVTTARGEDDTPVTAVADENIAVILDELTGLHNELDGLKEESLAEQAGEIAEIKSALAEIKDMVSRRTTIADDNAARDSAVSNELNVVLDEIINVKDEVAALKTDFATATETVAAQSESDAQAEKAAFADEMQTFKNELYAMVSEKLEELSVMGPEVSEELQGVKQQLADLQTLTVGGVAADDEQTKNTLAAELTEIKNMLAQSVQPAVSVEDLYNEVLSLRSELAAGNGAVATEGGTVTVDLGDVNKQLAEIRAQLGATPAAAAEPDEAVLGEILGLREELAAIREQLGNASAPAEHEPDAVVLGEMLSLREELAAIREQLGATSAQAESEQDNAVLGEILGLREEIERLRENSAASEETAGLREAMEAIKEDVRAIKEEPDLSIINEVLALRDEFQAFKDEMNKTRTAPQEDKSKEELVAQVQSLRDQLFAISMANVNDGTSNDVVYESYNNIILDEITALRDEIALLKQAGETKTLSDDLAQLKDKLTNMAVDDSEKTEAQLAEIRTEIAKLKTDEADATNNAVLQEIAALKAELANRREADATAYNYMSEMAQLLERQNAYLGQNAGDHLRDEIESLKDEIASSLTAPAGESVVVDNSAVLEELAALRADLKKQNAADGNKQILREIAKLKDEIGSISEREPNDDGALSRSINDLKAELNQLAGFVDEEEQPAAQKPASRAKSGGKAGNKSGGRRKSTAKSANKTQNEENGLSADSLISKIDATAFAFPADAEDSALALNPDMAEAQPVPATSEEMDIAARIAKQVANKLIMEQLVQQLGDGSVPHSEVEEIVKDILPQEFTTVAVDEQTDKVRRLANSLVLDKLRARLKK